MSSIAQYKEYVSNLKKVITNQKRLLNKLQNELNNQNGYISVLKAERDKARSTQRKWYHFF